MLLLLLALCVCVTVAQFGGASPEGGARAFIRVFNLATEDDNDVVFDDENNEETNYNGPSSIEVFYTTSDDDDGDNDEDKDEEVNADAGFNDYETIDLPVDENGDVFNSQGSVYIDDLKICSYNIEVGKYNTLTITSEIDEDTENGDCVDNSNEEIGDGNCSKVVKREISFSCDEVAIDLPERVCNAVPAAVVFEEDLTCPLLVLRTGSSDNNLLTGEAILHSTMDALTELTRGEEYKVDTNTLANAGVQVDFQVDKDSAITSHTYEAANFNFVNAANRVYDDDNDSPTVDDQLIFVIKEGNTVVHVNDNGVATGAEAGWLRLPPGNYDIDVYSGDDDKGDIFANPQTVKTPVQSDSFTLADGDALILVVTGSAGNGNSDDNLDFEKISVPTDELWEGETEHHIYNFIDNQPVAIAAPDDNCCNFLEKELGFKDSAMTTNRDGTGQVIANFITDYDVFTSAENCRDLTVDELDGGSFSLGTLTYSAENGLCGRQVHILIGRTYEEDERIDGCDADDTATVTKVGDLNFQDQDGSGNMEVLTIDVPHCSCKEVVSPCTNTLSCELEAEFETVDSSLSSLQSSVSGVVSNTRTALNAFQAAVIAGQNEANSEVIKTLNNVDDNLGDIEKDLRDIEKEAEEGAENGSKAEDEAEEAAKLAKKVLSKIKDLVKDLEDSGLIL